MRLIDANAMYKRYCVDKEGLDGIYDATDLPDMLASMPTIGAIPLDWMDAQIHGYASRLQSTELKALLIVKGLWEKDQEGKS